MLHEVASDAVRDLFEAQIGVFRLLEIIEEHQDTVERESHEIANDLSPDIPLDERRKIGARLAQTALVTGRDVDENRVHDVAEQVSLAIHASRSGLDSRTEEALVGITLRRDLGARARESLLVTLWSDFEAFLTSLLYQIAELNPAPLIAEDHQVKLSDIEAHGSIDDLKLSIATRKIDAMVHDTLDSAIEVFCDKYQLHRPELSDQLKEAYLRRNVVVHAGARANSMYLSSIAGLAIDAPSQDERLTVSSDYLTRVADELACTAFSLAVSAAAKYSESQREVVESAFVNLPYFLLLAQRPGAVRLIGEKFSSKGFSSQAAQEVMKVNHMIACRDQGDDERLRQLLKRWDVSALSEVFQLAKLTLQRRNETALAKAIRLRAEHKLDERFWLMWPLFRELRALERSKRNSAGAPGVDTMPNETDTGHARTSGTGRTEESQDDN